MNPHQSLSEIFEILSTPSRLQVLLVIGSSEACVCHLEAALGLRQAYISQQLMYLREKNIITARREGKYIYYSLADLALLDILYQAARLSGLSDEQIKIQPSPDCPCPHCTGVVIRSDEIEVNG